MSMILISKTIMNIKKVFYYHNIEFVHSPYFGRDFLLSENFFPRKAIIL